ncbi:MAG: glycyl-radical enzyme activating protein [candidate division Zixibacteria bacterium]|nr:glycyl-radical enzyme activating protein [candidate division Zixibacteria bacterium]
MSTGVVFDIKRYAIHDGPGIRTTVFFKGCLLDCPWCHNPEGKAKEKEFMWWQEKCIKCGDCQSACPKGAISFSNDSLLLNKAKCDLCGACADACHSEALKLVGQKVTVDQVMREIQKDVAFYDESGGGVTLSGGEPLLQPDFSYSLLKACKELGIHTAVDTCGHTDSEILLRISRHVDLFLYDLKVIDDDKHRKFTGVSNSLIVKNLKKLSDSGQQIIVRFPLVPGVNDSQKDIHELGEFVSSLKGVRELNILPYHKGGAEKSKRLRGSANPFFSNHSRSAEMLSQIQKKLKGFGLKIQIGG